MRRTYAQFKQEERRLVLLRLLYEEPEQRGNSSSLFHALEMLGLSATRAEVRAELEWLGGHELVVVTDITPPTSDTPLLLAQLTEHGRDVAKGRVTVPGVLKPGR